MKKEHKVRIYDGEIIFNQDAPKTNKLKKVITYIKNNMQLLFPSLLVLLDLVASIVYLCKQDYRHAVYWLSAAILTASVTF